MKTSPLELLRKLATRFSTRAVRDDSTQHGAKDSFRPSGGEWDDDEEHRLQGLAVDDTQALLGTLPIDSDVHVHATWNDRGIDLGGSKAAQAIDHFEIRRLLGQGGFGSVFLAYDTRLDRMVALKLLDRLEKIAARRMLDHETKSASKLKHPNLVTVFQSGEHERGCYIVFEYVPGSEPGNASTLRQRFDKGRRIEPKQAVHFIRQITEALAYAHNANVVHRDIKPENILVDFKGTAYLADFGCARQSKRHLEGTASLVGTLPYMSIEQIEGKWNSQTDIWSIGVVLFEMLSGKRPFAFAEKTQSRSAAEAAFGFAAAVLEAKQLPPIEGVDADLMAICQKCLHKRPEDRYESAADLAADLASWQRHEPVSCRRISVVERLWRWARRNPVVAAQTSAIAGLLVCGIVVSTFFANKMWQARKEYVYKQIAQFDQVDAETFRGAVANLENEPFRQLAVTRLAQQWRANSDSTDEGQDASQRNRLAAALLTFDRSTTGEKPPPQLVQLATDRVLRRLLVTDNPDEFRFLLGYYVVSEKSPPPSELQRLDTLWQLAEQSDSEKQRFRALVALSNYDPKSARWNEMLATQLAEGILGQPTTDVLGWAQNSIGLTQLVLPALNREIDSPNPHRRARAEIAYAALAKTPVEIAKRVVRTSSSEVARELLLQLKAGVLTDEERRAVGNVFHDRSEELNPYQLANQSMARVYLEGPTVGGDLSIFDEAAPIDARLAFELNAAPSGLSVTTLSDWIDRLVADPNSVDAAQTALLALGHMDVNAASTSVREKIVSQVLGIHRNNPHVRIHAAAERALRQWNVGVPTIDPAPYGDVEDSWRVNSLGQLLVRVRLPNGIACEVTAYEVTLAEYANYVRSRAENYVDNKLVMSQIRGPIVGHFNNYLRELDREAIYDENNIPTEHQRLPIRNVTALQAMAYCIWVSEQSQVPADELCFEVETQGDDSLLEAVERNLSGDYLSVVTGCNRQAHGYRLPFQDEWLQLTTELPSASELFDDIGWYQGNSQGRIWPVGKKRPNDRGIFDLRGNVAEWYLRIQSGHVELGTMGASFSAEITVEQKTANLEAYSGDAEIGYRLIRMLE